MKCTDMVVPIDSGSSVGGGGDIDNRSICRKTCSSTTLSTTNPNYTGLVSNLCLRGEKPVPDLWHIPTNSGNSWYISCYCRLIGYFVIKMYKCVLCLESPCKCMADDWYHTLQQQVSTIFSLLVWNPEVKL